MALGACALWGLVFVIPALLEDFSVFQIAFGRCLVFGLFSFTIFLIQNKRLRKILNLKSCKEALKLSFVGNLLHYMALIVGIQMGNVVLATLILGVSPLSIAWYATYRKNGSLPINAFFPSLFILGGLFLIHFNILNEVVSYNEYFWSITCSCVALATWTWFIVANDDFLKKTSFPSQDWVTVLGVATLFWVFIGFLVFFLLFPDHSAPLNLQRSYLIGSVVLGVGSSWCAQYLWNLGSRSLPLSLAGYLVIFETLFGLLFTYILGMRQTNPIDIIGTVLIITGIFFAIRSLQHRIFHDHPFSEIQGQ